MANKQKGPKFDELHQKADEIETRYISVKRKGLEAPSSATLYFNCPFCNVEVKAYLWLLSGGGKRCDCGALFTGLSGRAVHFKNKSHLIP